MRAWIEAPSFTPLCQPPNKQLQWTVIDKVLTHMRLCAAAELRRWA
jgi:hypothetical protein